jgi:predicted  nucleic acid-binding Zn-ribbon protein
MKVLDNKVISLTQKLDSKIKKLDKLNAQVERANRLIYNYDVKLQLKEQLSKNVRFITNDILGLKEEFVNNDANFLLDHIEEFAKTVLGKFKDLNRINKEIAKRIDLTADDINSKIEAIITLNNKRLKKIDALKLEIINLEDQIDEMNAKLRAEFNNEYIENDA